MELSGLTKLIVCVLVLVSAVILGVNRVIASESVVAILTGVLGYVYGNGHGIMSAKKRG